jgi:hypothetical protein
LWKIFAFCTAEESVENDQQKVIGFPQKMLKKEAPSAGTPTNPAGGANTA